MGKEAAKEESDVLTSIAKYRPLIDCLEKSRFAGL